MVFVRHDRRALAAYCIAWVCQVRNRVRIRHLLPLWFTLALTACDSSRPAPTIEALTPRQVTQFKQTEMTVTGTGFLDTAHVSLSSSSRATIGDVWRVRLSAGSDDAVFDTTDVQHVDAQTLKFTLPADRELEGNYDLSVDTPGGVTLELPAALVVEAVIADPTLQLRIETAADGQGELCDSTNKHALADTLDCYAVLRDTSGEFRANVSVDWTLTQTSGESTSSATHITVTFHDAGTATLTASYKEAFDASATWQVTGGETRAAKLEVVPDSQTVTAGDPALVFTVRGTDADGNATSDVGELTWGIANGDLGVFSAADATLTPELAGSGQIAVHSSYDLSDVSGTINVIAGRATELKFAPLASDTLHAGDDPIALSVSARDAYGNPTDDLGDLTWSVMGPIGELDTNIGVLTPKQAGIGRIIVTSNYGVHAETTELTILPGAATDFAIVPNSLTIDIGSAPVQFTVSVRDAYGNETADDGTLTWSVASGTLSGLTSSGSFTPSAIGYGTFAVVSTSGASASSGAIQVLPIHATTLSISPQTWTGKVGDASQVFTVEGHDTSGKLTTNLGTLTYAVASGPISDMDGPSGTFAPRTAGDGTISVVSSYGVRADTQTIHVDPFTAPATLNALRAPNTVWPGEHAVRIELDIANTSTRDVVISGALLTFALAGSDISDEYVVRADRRNVERIAASSTSTFTFFVDAIGPVDKFGTLTISALVELFVPSGYSYTRSISTTTALWLTNLGVQVAITAPLQPNTRLCVNGIANFSASTTRAISPTFDWRFAVNKTSTLAAPTAKYLSIGTFPFEVTATDSFGWDDTALGSPIYVGALAATSEATYPAGPLLITSPSAAQNVPLASLPRTDLIQTSTVAPLRQCDGTALTAPGQRTLTAYSDRNLLHPSVDVDSSRPGIQVMVATTGVLPSIALRAPSYGTEGPTTLYFEYVDDATQRVTAAGDTTFQLTQDVTRPTITQTVPSANCGEDDCFGKGDVWIFRFSEAISATSLSGVTVSRLTGRSCTSAVSADLTATSVVRYDTSARTLFVIPAAQTSDDYTVKVTVPATVIDTAATPNTLAAFTRCARVSSVAAATRPQMPFIKALDHAVFSPDGDAFQDTSTWTVRVDDQTTALQMRIRRATGEVWAQVLPVAGAGYYTLTWDGSDLTGRNVDNGVYRFDLSAFNRAGLASASRSGFIEVDNAVQLVSVRRRD